MVDKRKNPADNALPPRVYRGKTQYEFHPASGGSISLCPLDSLIPVIWVKYEQANNYRNERKTLEHLINQFFLSADFMALAAETKKDYKRNSTKLLPVFGKMHPDNVKPQHIRKYMDKRGTKSKTQANHEKRFLSRVYRWSYERGITKGNPCSGVRQFKEEARDRYITDAEYEVLYSVAPDTVRIAMEIAYLCCARQSDVLSLIKSQLLDDGIFICQGKTGKKQIKAWTERLKKVIDLADSLPASQGVNSIYVLHQPNGNRYTRDGFNSSWAKARAKASVLHPELTFDFTFHDLKAKGISDLEGSLSEKQAISGHKSIGQTARYNRKTEIVPVVGGQKK